MHTTVLNNEKNVGAFIHLSTFLKYFFPFANFIAPLIIWSTNKDKEFVDAHGREAINFQLSMLVYTLTVGLICLPFAIIFAFDFITLIESMEHSYHEISMQEIKNFSGYLILLFSALLLFFGLFVIELYAVISATIKASKGEYYKYPLCIPFLKTNIKDNNHEHAS